MAERGRCVLCKRLTLVESVKRKRVDLVAGGNVVGSAVFEVCRRCTNAIGRKAQARP